MVDIRDNACSLSVSYALFSVPISGLGFRKSRIEVGGFWSLPLGPALFGTWGHGSGSGTESCLQGKLLRMPP
eukprot:782611-Pyramimonas_sp.AAC.1